MKKSASQSSSQAPENTAPEQRLTAEQLAEAFAMFSRASEELSGAYNALQGQVEQLTDRLSVLMGALPAGVLVLDSARRVVQINRAAERLLGRDCEQRGWSEIRARLRPAGAPGEYALGQGADMRRLSLSEASLESGEEMIVLLHDVTDSHRMREQAERNERLAAMGEMVAGLAHQLRTPLSAALLYTSTLRNPELPAHDRYRVGDRAIERLRHLERLIGDMLRFARGGNPERQRFAVCELVYELAHTFEPVARARLVHFASRCECGTLHLVGDRKALSGALTHLTENALQAAGEQGRVDIHVFLDGPDVSFRVVDSGPGIAEAEQTRVFEPFFTTRTEGTGLGLALARDVARAHGGDVTLESAPGQGAAFTLKLPCGDDADKPGSGV